MVRLKKVSSPAIAAAETRLAGIKSIDSQLKLSETLSVELFEMAIDATHKALETYNTKLSDVDEAKDSFEKAERALATMTTDMLSAVGLKFKRDSIEYEKAGGKRTTGRRKRRENDSGDSTPTPAK